MFSSVEHEIFSANKYENANNSWHFSYLLAEKISHSAMFSNKEFAFVSYLRFISMTNFMLSRVEHKKIIITLGPDQPAEIHTVKPQWLKHLCLVYHGLLELVFESLGNSLDSPRKQIFVDILGKFSYFIMKCMLCVLIRIASLRWF